MSQSSCVLTLGATRFVVEPTLGGRITEFSCAGENVLLPLEDLGAWTNGGSTFWTSPQRDWGWPPNPTLDREPYSVSFDRELQTLTLESRKFSVAGSTLSIAKKFYGDNKRQAVELEYQITNHGPELEVAGWEISRVRATGISFFAANATKPLGGLPEPSNATYNGVVWMDHQAQSSEAKLGAEPTQGFVAYATPSLLFVKTFVDVPASSVVDSEAPIELYVKPESYVEIEQQSAATLLGPGQRLSYRLSWFLRTMRPDINVTSMNEQLLAFTRQVGDLPE